MTPEERDLQLKLVDISEPVQELKNPWGFSPDVLLAGWRRWVRGMILRGWVLSSTGTLRHEGSGVVRPANGFSGHWNAPWDTLYNPRTDAPAAVMGATFVSANRYRYGLMTLDRNGCVRRDDECDLCGALPGDPYRKINLGNDNLFGPVWKQRFEPCPRCSGPQAG